MDCGIVPLRWCYFVIEKQNKECATSAATSYLCIDITELVVTRFSFHVYMRSDPCTQII